MLAGQAKLRVATAGVPVHRTLHDASGGPALLHGLLTIATALRCNEEVHCSILVAL